MTSSSGPRSLRVVTDLLPCFLVLGGLGTALALAREGCRVAIAGRRADVLAQAAASWREQPAILHQPCDVADRASVEKLFTWAARELGRVDILVCAAGVNI